MGKLLLPGPASHMGTGLSPSALLSFLLFIIIIKDLLIFVGKPDLQREGELE